MKVLFIKIKILAEEKLSRLIPDEQKEGNTGDNHCLVSLTDSVNGIEGLLKELEVSEEVIEEIKSQDLENLLIIVNDGIRFNGFRKHGLNLKRSGSLGYKNFNVNLDQEEVYINNKRIKLTTLEYNLLLFFINNAKKIVSREEIINYLWGADHKLPTAEVTLYTHIKNLKKKLLRSGIDNFIHSIYGHGYKFEDPDEIIP